jgi:hypothetical protein
VNFTIVIRNACLHNLKNVSLAPSGTGFQNPIFIGITG